MECSFVDAKATDKHLNLAEAVRLIRMAEPRNAMLTHFYAEWDEVDFEKEMRRVAPGCEVIQAEDGLRFSVSTN
jgi:ribonuclease BN (tRNA processing enzyme)